MGEPQITDEELASLSCKFDWQQCPCLPCKARREIVRLRGSVQQTETPQQDAETPKRRFTFEVLSPPASIQVTATDPDGNSVSEHWPVTIG